MAPSFNLSSIKSRIKFNNKTKNVKNMDFKLLKQLYKIHSKSGYEGKIISFVCKLRLQVD